MLLESRLATNAKCDVGAGAGFGAGAGTGAGAGAGAEVGSGVDGETGDKGMPAILQPVTKGRMEIKIDSEMLLADITNPSRSKFED